eukprot:scaffold2797_cov112-Isochrysis_galbana.AAC.4
MLKSAGARTSALVKAQARLASSCGLNSPSRGSASAAMAPNIERAGWPAAAKAHAVLARPCAEKPADWAAVRSAMASKRAAVTGGGGRGEPPCRPAATAVAKAQARLASSCGLNSPSRGRASVAITSSMEGVARRARTNAHAVLASACGVKSRRRGGTACPSPVHSCAHGALTRAPLRLQQEERPSRLLPERAQKRRVALHPPPFWGRSNPAQPRPTRGQVDLVELGTVRLVQPEHLAHTGRRRDAPVQHARARRRGRVGRLRCPDGLVLLDSAGRAARRRPPRPQRLLARRSHTAIHSDQLVRERDQSIGSAVDGRRRAGASGARRQDPLNLGAGAHSGKAILSQTPQPLVTPQRPPAQRRPLPLRRRAPLRHHCPRTLRQSRLSRLPLLLLLQLAFYPRGCRRKALLLLRFEPLAELLGVAPHQLQLLEPIAERLLAATRRQAGRLALLLQLTKGEDVEAARQLR